MDRFREFAIVCSSELRRLLGSGRGMALGSPYLAALLFWSQVILGGAAKLQLVVSGSAGTEMGTGLLPSFLQGLMGPELADVFTAVPPPVLVFVFVGFLVLPGLACISAHDTIAREVSVGSARFALTRCRRSSWVLGKLFGQSLVLASFVLVCGVGVLALHSPSMPVFVSGLSEFIRYALLMSLYGATFCAATTVVSASSSRPFLALLVSFATVFMFFVLSFTGLEVLSPFHHAAGFLVAGQRATSALGCLLLSATGAIGSCLVFSRRDI